jgi:HTH-type transcriptional regulator / antitoxin HigA
MKQKNAPPGELIRNLLKERGWTQIDLAKIMDRPLPTINEIIAGKRQITPETAIQLSIVFNNDAKHWLDLESAYRLSLATADESIKDRARLYELAPIKDMERRGWIKKTESSNELENELKKFFDVDDLTNPLEIAARTRKTALNMPITPEQRAWCFRAQQLARTLQVDKYDEDNFSKGIVKLRHLAAWPEETRKVPRVLSEMGIIFVVIEPLPRSKIDGAAFWINNRPVIALSLRYDRLDNFWHTLGHELSHIKHRDDFGIDTDIVGENRQMSVELDNIELRAERESAATLLDDKELNGFIVRVGPLYSRARINQFANRLRIHPAIIVGHLQHRGEISYGTMRDQLVKIRDIVTSEALTDGWGHILQLKG